MANLLAGGIHGGAALPQFMLAMTGRPKGLTKEHFENQFRLFCQSLVEQAKTRAASASGLFPDDALAGVAGVFLTALRGVEVASRKFLAACAEAEKEHPSGSALLAVLKMVGHALPASVIDVPILCPGQHFYVYWEASIFHLCSKLFFAYDSLPLIHSVMLSRLSLGSMQRVLVCRHWAQMVNVDLMGSLT